MVSRLPIYTRATDGERVDAWLVSRDIGGQLPLKRIVEECVEPINAPPIHPTAALVGAAQAALPDRRIRETIAAVAKASAALASVAPALETIAAVSRTVAAVERFGVPAIVSSSPLSSDEAAQRLREAPPRLSAAEEANDLAVYSRKGP